MQHHGNFSTYFEMIKCSTIRLFLLGFKTVGSESFYCLDMYIKLQSPPPRPPTPPYPWVNFFSKFVINYFLFKKNLVCCHFVVLQMEIFLNGYVKGEKLNPP